MGTGYTRNDTANNIADGNVINAADLDGEFDAIESAFNSSTGHTHDGTSAEGAPIEVLGPTQDVVITASALRPKTDNTVDLGTSSLMYKDGFFDGTITMHSLVVLDDEATDATIKLDGNYPDGTANVALGLTALDSLDGVSPGGNNIAIGNAALTALTTGSHNIAIGSSAGDALTTGGKNIAIGFEALSTEDGNGESTAIGYQALKTQNAGASGLNVAVGYLAGTAVSTGVKNTLLGAEAGDAINSGGSNVAVGYGALTATTTSSSNTAVGADALKTNITGESNVAVGNTALEVATGSNNTAIGKDAGNLITTGAANTIIGQFDGNQGTVETLDIRTSSNHIVLSDGAGEPRVVVNDTGKVFMGGATSTVAVGGGPHDVQIAGTIASRLSLLRYAAAVSGSNLTLGHTRSATVGTVGTTLVDNDILGQIDFAGDDGADVGTIGARIRALVDGTPSSNNMPSDLVFQTFEDGGSLTERMRITSTGKVNIGLNNPTLDDELLSVLNDILIVTQVSSPNNTAGGSIHLGATGTSGTTHQVEIKSHRGADSSTGELSFSVGDGSSITEAMRIDSTKRLLIGATSSRSTAGGERAFQIEGTNGVTSSMSITRNSNDVNPPSVTLAKTRGTSVGDNTTVTDGDTVGLVAFAAADGTDANSRVAEVEAQIDGTPASNDTPGRLVFSTTSSGSVATTERMRITSTGNVGIGADSPSSLISGGDGPILSIGGTDTALGVGEKTGTISFITNDSSYTGTYSDGIAAEIAALSETSVGGGYGLAFYTGVTTDSNRGERVRITDTGQVGIGTSTPSADFHIVADDSGTANPHLMVETTDAGTNPGPEIHLWRNSASPAASDGNGIIRFYGEDSAGNQEQYGYIYSQIVDPTSGSESGKLTTAIKINGATKSVILASPTEVVINDGSEDVNFRVESNDKTHMLYVDAADNRIGIGNVTSAPDAVLHISDGSAGAKILLESTADSAADGPILDLYRNSASPADDDNLALIYFSGESDTGTKLQYARIDSFIEDATDGAEDGRLIFQVVSNGTSRQFIGLRADQGGAAGQIVFNESQLDIDFKVEGGAETNLFYANAGTDRIGIGTGSPGAKLEIKSTETTGLKITNTDGGASTPARLTFFKDGGSPADADSIGQIDFSGEDSGGTETVYARIRAVSDDVTNTTEDGHLSFWTRTANVLSEKVRIRNTGGITFNGDTSGDNALNDYEEGTWTPVFADATSGGNTVTSSSGIRGVYTKIGNMVTVNCSSSNLDTTGMTSGNDLRIQGLPFTPTSVTSPNQTYPGGTQLGAVGFSASGFVQAYALDNLTYVRLGESRDGTTLDIITVGELTSGAADIQFTITYFTNA